MSTITTEPPKAELEPVLQMPGIVATKTSLTVFESATEAQLIKAFAQIAKMNVSLAWWLGDLGLAIQERKRAQYAKEAAGLRLRANECTTDAEGMDVKRGLLERADKMEGRAIVEYTRELCTAHGISESHVRNSVALARFYEPAKRLAGLTPHHHAVARDAVLKNGKTVAEAVEWLETAEDKDWRASELRKEVKMAEAPFKEPDAEPEPLTFDELAAADKWAGTFNDASLTDEQVKKLYALGMSLWSLGERLRGRL